MLPHRALARLSHLIGGVAFVIGAVATLVFVQLIETRFFPIKDMKLIDSYEIQGSDVWISGAFRKIRNCQYIGPVRAVDETGNNLYVVSHNRTAGNNWQPDALPRRFGPWQLVNGAGHRVTIYQEYACHSLWKQFDDVAIIDARTSTVTVEMAR